MNVTEAVTSRRALMIMDVEQLGGTIMEQLAELFEDEKGAKRGRR